MLDFYQVAERELPFALAIAFVIAMSCFSHIAVMAENCDAVEFTSASEEERDTSAFWVKK